MSEQPDIISLIESAAIVLTKIQVHPEVVSGKALTDPLVKTVALLKQEYGLILRERSLKDIEESVNRVLGKPQ